MPPDRPPSAARGQELSQGLYDTKHHSRAPSTFPGQLEGKVPQCAVQCLSTYISQEYNCPYDDFSCFCEEYSSYGFTLGELAYICFKENCKDQTTSEALSQYYLCSAQPYAVQPTHSTLTIPPTATSASNWASSDTAIAHSTANSNPPKSHQTTFQTFTRSAASISTAATETARPGGPGPSASHSSHATTGTAAASSPSTHSATLNSSQAAGVSIGVIGSVALIVGLFYYFCVRRRREKDSDEKSSYDFIDRKPSQSSKVGFRGSGLNKAASSAPPSSPWIQRISNNPDPRRNFSQFPRQPVPAHDRTVGAPPDHFANQPTVLHEKKSDISPESAQSYESMRTLSQLLPDKPEPLPMRVAPSRPNTASFQLPPTVYEERPHMMRNVDSSDRRPYVVAGDVPAHSRNVSAQSPKYAGFSPRRDVERKAPAAPPPRPPRPTFAGDSARSPQASRHPTLSLAIPVQASRQPTLPVPAAFPTRVSSVQGLPYEKQREEDVPKPRSRESSGSLLNYYASPEAGSTASPEMYSPTPIDDEIQKRKAVPVSIKVVKPTYPPAAVRRDSNASDTSFESGDLDDTTPPEEVDRQLTPVMESPIAQYSPIASIRYPKIPRSSNQVVPRSPSVQMSPIAMSLATSTSIGRTNTPGTYHQGQSTGRTTPGSIGRQGSIAQTLGGSTLASKRRGEDAAKELSLHLPIQSPNSSCSNSQHSSSGSNSSHGKFRRALHSASPLKGYHNRTRRTQPKAQTKGPPPELWQFPPPPGAMAGGPKSPLWEPKLTPARKGDDLYLQVGVASPRDTAFQL